MFKKPFSTSGSGTSLRSSDARKLQEEISISYDLPKDHVKVIMRDGLTVQNVRTHLDESVTIYSEARDPLFFRFGKGKGKGEGPLIPTCYFLDRIALSYLPVLITADEVVEHLVGGSNLFSKGVSSASLNALPSTAKEGNLVAIAADSDHSRIIAIGTLAKGRTELLSDRSGAAVHTLHARNDYLWKAGSGKTAETMQFEAESTTEGGVTSELESLTLEESKVESLPESKAMTDPTSNQENIVLSPIEVDSMLRTALLLTLQQNKPTFPLPASAFYSLLLANRPAHCSHYDLKQSSYKKLPGFFKVIAAEGIITTKEIKSELKIMSAKLDHPAVETVKSFKTVADAAKSSNATTSATPSAAIKVIEYLKPNSTIDQLISGMTEKRQPFYRMHELSLLFNKYVDSNKLSHPRDAAHIILDDRLSDAILKKGELLGTLSRKESIERIVAGCQHWHSLTFPGGEETFHKGSCPSIRVIIKDVGKRVVTLISGFEHFGIQADALSLELKSIACAASSISPLQGASSKNPKSEILLQGSQLPLVTKLVTQRGVAKSLIVMEKK